MRRRLADRDRWALQLVLRLAEPIHLAREPETDLAAVHFGWKKVAAGRRVATVARSADPAEARDIVLLDSVEEDLARATALTARRAANRKAIVERLGTFARQHRVLPDALGTELAAMRMLPADKVAASRVYRLRQLLTDAGIRRSWLDAWIAEDRKQWQAALMMARRARGRRRDFYRRVALELARRHRAVVLEPLDLKAASRATDAASGAWSAFSRHARAGRAVVALHEFDRAIRWACARHATAVFDLTGLTTRTCATCGSVDVVATRGSAAHLQCLHCGTQHDRYANAAACAWSHARAGLDHRLAGYRKLAARHARDVQSAADSRKAAIADSRYSGRTTTGKA